MCVCVCVHVCDIDINDFMRDACCFVLVPYVSSFLFSFVFTHKYDLYVCEEGNGEMEVFTILCMCGRTFSSASGGSDARALLGFRRNDNFS